MPRSKKDAQTEQSDNVQMALTAVKALAEIARRSARGIKHSAELEAMTQHVKSFETYMELTTKAIGIYLFVTATTYTLFFANYARGKESAKLVLLLPTVASVAFFLVLLVGLAKWCVKRKGYEEFKRKFKLDQLPDTEMLTLVLLVASGICVVVGAVTVQILTHL